MFKNSMFVLFGAAFTFSTSAFALSLYIPPQQPLPKGCWQEGAGSTVGTICRETDPLSKLPDPIPKDPGPYFSPRTNDFQTKTVALNCGDLKNRLNAHYASGQTYEAMLAERTFHTEILEAVKKRVKELEDLGVAAGTNSTFKASMKNEISCLKELTEKSEFAFRHASLLAVEMLNQAILAAQPPASVVATPQPPEFRCGTKSRADKIEVMPAVVEFAPKRIPANTEKDAVRASN